MTPSSGYLTTDLNIWIKSLLVNFWLLSFGKLLILSSEESRVHLPDSMARTLNTYSSRKRQPEEHESSGKFTYLKEIEIGLAFYMPGRRMEEGQQHRTLVCRYTQLNLWASHHALQVFFWVISTLTCYTWWSASTRELTNSRQIKKWRGHSPN